MKKIIFTLCLLLAACDAKAANILISSDVCASAVAATPAPDVAYQAGKDVNGNAVAPADLPGSAPPIVPPETIQIPLQLNLQNALHIPNNSNLVSPQAIVGTIEYKGGQVTFNGQPVGQDAQAQIEAACAHSRPETASAAATESAAKASGSAAQPSGSASALTGQRSKNLLMGQ